MIEGFYGPPWSMAERMTAFDQMAAWGLTTYLYCPKDDLHHRAVWREPYGDLDAAQLRAVVDACHARGLRFIYGLGPGLDVRYASEADRASLRARVLGMLALGADGIALLFDDIPDRLDAADIARWQASDNPLAAAQADLTNEIARHVRAARRTAWLAFCPTPDCGRMLAAGHGGPHYLETLGAHLDADIDVFWTGPEIVSSTIDVAHVRAIASRLGRRPILWDNLHANDYDSRRLLLGPYAGRPLALRDEVGGIFTNPNTEFPLDFMALRTLARFLQADGVWDERAEYLAALDEWRPAFETVSGPVALEDLLWLADCFYLPCDEGPEAERFLADAARALTDAADGWRAQAEAFRAEAVRRRDFCARLATLRDRPLFHALSRRVWDLREEIDLLVRAVEARLASADGSVSFTSDFHLPRTYRGGTVARLQALLQPQPDGRFVVAGGGA